VKPKGGTLGQVRKYSVAEGDEQEKRTTPSATTPSAEAAATPPQTRRGANLILDLGFWILD
jgi:hypothetical protein